MIAATLAISAAIETAVAAPGSSVECVTNKEVIGALEVGHDGDHDVDGDDHKRPRAEPMRLADLAPLVLNGNEAPATGQRRVHLSVVEPAVLVHMGGVGERPLGTL